MKDANIWATNYFIKSQDKKYIDWENEVCFQIELQDNSTTSDAQGLMELQDEYLTKAWKSNTDPIETAKQIIILSTVN